MVGDKSCVPTYIKVNFGVLNILKGQLFDNNAPFDPSLYKKYTRNHHPRAQLTFHDLLSR